MATVFGWVSRLVSCTSRSKRSRRSPAARAAGQELDGGRAAEHGVAGAVHVAHAALADLLLERVLPELPRLAHLLAQAVDDAGSHGGEDHRHHEPRSRPHGLGGRAHEPVAGPEEDGGGHDEGGDDRQHSEGEGPARGGRHDHGPADEDHQDGQERPRHDFAVVVLPKREEGEHRAEAAQSRGSPRPRPPARGGDEPGRSRTARPPPTRRCSQHQAVRAVGRPGAPLEMGRRSRRRFRPGRSLGRSGR